MLIVTITEQTVKNNLSFWRNVCTFSIHTNCLIRLDILQKYASIGKECYKDTEI